MTDLRKRIESDEGWFEHLTRSIPGFGGYKERENRRTADQILRKQLAADLEQQAKRLEDLKLQMTNQGNLELLADVDRLGRKLNRCVDLIRYANYGYTGFFDAIKIKEDDLDRMYEYDAAIGNRLTELAQALDQLVAATGEGLGAALTNVTQLVVSLESQWQDREKVMKGMMEEGAP